MGLSWNAFARGKPAAGVLFQDRQENLKGKIADSCERPRSLRIDPRAWVWVECEGKPCHLANLSRTGGFVGTETPPAVGRKVELRLVGERLVEPLELTAIVRHRKPGLGMGVQFMRSAGRIGLRLEELLSSLSIRRILVMDNDENTRQALTRALGEQNYWVLTAADCKQGLQMAFNSQPDLIMLDAATLGPSGLEFCQRLQASHVAGIPIVILSARNNLSGLRAMQQWGALMCFPKPFQATKLLSYVRLLLGSAPAYPAQAPANKAIQTEGAQNERPDRFAAVAGERLRQAAGFKFSELPYDQLVSVAAGWYHACTEAVLRGHYLPIYNWVHGQARRGSEQGFELAELLELLCRCRQVAIETEGWHEDFFAELDAVIDDALAGLRSEVPWTIPAGLNYLTYKSPAPLEGEQQFQPLTPSSQVAEAAARERRAHDRSKLSLPVRIIAVLREGVMDEVTTTENVAMGGVYIITETPYLQWTSLEVMYPFWDTPGAMNRACRAQVMRVDELEGSKRGVAIKFRRHLGSRSSARRTGTCLAPFASAYSRTDAEGHRPAPRTLAGLSSTSGGTGGGR